jgi:Rnl2 family RNA ligase
MDNFIIFKRYHSIENSYLEKNLQYINACIPSTTQWVALEKVHGCNFSATSNGDSVKWGSRSAYLGDSALQSFHNADQVRDKYTAKINHLFDALQTQDSRIAYIRVFGELYGGKYPGMKNLYKAVQKEVCYTPAIDFIVFDIQCLYLAPSPSGEGDGYEDPDNLDRDISGAVYTHYYKDALDVISLCHGVGIPTLEVQSSGTLQDLLALNPTFTTTLPALFGLPTIAGNNAEGYVLKPVTYHRASKSRVILKHKNPAFREDISVKR